jgi:cyclophilin family peptidyl-prolyl cis-trans isomerase
MKKIHLIAISVIVLLLVACSVPNVTAIEDKQNIVENLNIGYSRHSDMKLTMGISYDGFAESYPLTIVGDISANGSDFSGVMTILEQDEFQDRQMRVISGDHFFKYPDRNNWAKLASDQTSLTPISLINAIFANISDTNLRIESNNNQNKLFGQFESSFLAPHIPILEGSTGVLNAEIITNAKTNQISIIKLKSDGTLISGPDVKGPNGENVELAFDVTIIDSEFNKNVTLISPPIPPSPKNMTWNNPPEYNLESGKDYSAVIKMFDGGEIEIDLYENLVPITVNNFVFLSQQGFYDGVTFHRVIDGFMAQGGDPSGSGQGGPGYVFDNEFNAKATHSSEGIISMANSGIYNGSGTNGSQFFITFSETSMLDGINADGTLKDCAIEGISCHSVFGKVVNGMDVVNTISIIDPSLQGPPGDAIESISILVK